MIRLLISVILLVQLIGCTSSKKVTQTQTKSVDTTTSFHTLVRTDTASATDVKQLKDINITYYYNTDIDTGDTKIADTETVYDFIPDHSRITKVTVHVGDYKDSSSSTAASASRDTLSKVSLKTKQVAQTITETKTAYPWWIWVVGVLLLLFIIYKIVK